MDGKRQPGATTEFTRVSPEPPRTPAASTRAPTQPAISPLAPRTPVAADDVEKAAASLPRPVGVTVLSLLLARGPIGMAAFVLMFLFYLVEVRADGLFILFVASFLGISAVVGAIAFGIWRGHPWARAFVIGLAVAANVAAVGLGTYRPMDGLAVGVGALTITAAAGYLLMPKPSAWFRAHRARRRFLRPGPNLLAPREWPRGVSIVVAWVGGGLAFAFLRFLTTIPTGSLMTSMDGATLKGDTFFGLLIGTALTASAVASILARHRKGRPILPASTVGLLSAFLVFLTLAVGAQELASTDVVNGHVRLAENSGRSMLILLTFAAWVASGLTFSTSNDPESVFSFTASAALLATGIGMVLFALWMGGQVPDLQASAAARTHRNTPGFGVIGLAVALAAVALMRAKRRPPR